MPAPDSSDGTRAAPQSNVGTKPLLKGAVTLPDVQLPSRIGKFEIKGILGEGAFGRVFLGFDAELERQVAIKVPKPEELTADLRDRFLREARATAKIHHPNVCPVYEVGTEGEVPYMVMYYLAGTTLGAHLEKCKVLPPLNAVALTQRLALGMAAAHEKNVIHRDLKPQNILFDPERQLALITDFGLARIGGQSSHGTAAGSVFGTPLYMSPEQARGEMGEVGPLSDVYSLGVIFYRMLTGDVPFNGSIYEVLLQHCEAPPVLPSLARRGLDARLNALCLKAMAKKPTERYPSAKAFAEALGDFLHAGSTAWLAADETHGTPVPTATPVSPDSDSRRGLNSSGKRKSLPPGSPSPLPPHSDPLPLAEDDESGGLRLKILLGGIALLFVFIFVAVGVLVATRQRGPSVHAELPPDPDPDPNPAVVDPKPVPGPDKPVRPVKPLVPPTPANGFAGHAFDQEAERRAAAWVLSQGGVVQIVPKGAAGGAGGTNKAFSGALPITRVEDLPAAFTVAFISLRGRPDLLDEAFRTNLEGLSGPVQILLRECDQITDETVKIFASIPKLTSLGLFRTPRVTDASLTVFQGHPALEELSLMHTGITKAGIKQIAKLPALARFVIDLEDSNSWLADLAPLINLTDLTVFARDASELTEPGLVHLKAFKKLTRLALNGRNVTDDWLAKIAELNSLVRLDLVNTRVFGPGLVHLKKLPQLKTLILEDSLVRDEGMAYLADCARLEEVDLTGTGVGDTGARSLRRVSTLRKIVLSRTDVSANTIRLLEVELPKCKVFTGEK